MPGLDLLLGSSEAMRLVRTKSERILVGRGDRLPPLLLQGETGTGKGLLARCLHAESSRRGRPFIDVNCSAIPESLVEAEMFGFERGAFTDAQRAKPGLLQLAHEGTLFLDEVSLLPLHLQPKLLKALEDRSVRRLGGTRAEPADVWLIAATNESLADAVAAQRFRADLFHRLAVLTISLPSLRERGEDVMFLAEVFLARTCDEYGLERKSLSPGARAALQAHPWPGNVRELANAIERGALLSFGERIEASALELPSPDTRTARPATGEGEYPAEVVSPTAMDEVMRRHLLEVLVTTGWNVTQTSARLGLTRNTVRARMRKYGLSRDSNAKPGDSTAPKQAPLATAIRRVDVGWQPQLVAFVRVEISNVAPSTAARSLAAAEEKLRGFGGRTEETSPSGLVAVFGIEPLEDCVRRATLAALAIARLESSSDAAAALNVGVHAVQALVRPSAQAPVDHGSKRTAVLALEQIESARSAGERERERERGVLLSGAAAAFVARDFDLRPCGSEAFVANAPRPGPAIARDGAAPLVGRDTEIGLFLDRLEHAALGRRQVVAIVGEPGIGKSRLLRELSSAAADRVRWVDVRCWSHLASVPYAAIMDLVRQLSGLQDGDDGPRAEAKLLASAAPLSLAPPQITALLELFGFSDGVRAGLLAPEARKQAVLAAVGVLACMASRRRPLVLAFEDVHWMDATSEECVAALVDAVANESTLLVTSQRPGRELAWRGSSLFTQVALPPLTASQSETLFTGIACARGLPRSWMCDILGRAEGNPFFIEELTRSVLHHGEAGLRLPQTISEVLVYRLRCLSSELRRTLEVAAVLGRQFAPSLLQRLLPPDHPVGASLAELRRLELLAECPAEGEPLLTFQHALTQETAYSEVVADRRSELHGAAARVLEDVYAHRPEEGADIIAYHHERAADPRRAVDSLVASAARATMGYALEQAVVLLKRALGRAQELPAAERDPCRLDLANRLAHVLCISGRYQECLEMLTAHDQLVRRLDRADLSGPYHFWLGYIYSLLARHDQADMHAREAIALARASGLLALEGRARFVLAREAFFRCRFPEGLESGRQAVALLEGAGEVWWLGQAQWIVGINQLFMGQIAACLESEARAAALGETLGDARLKAYAGWTAGFAHACGGDGAAAIVTCREAVDQSRDPVNSALARGFLGFAHAVAGEPAAAMEHLANTVEELERFGLRKQEGTFRAFLAEAALAAGERERARAEANRALAGCVEAEFPFGAAWAERVLGRLMAREGSLTLAEELLARAAHTFGRIGADLERARTLRETRALVVP